MADAWEETQGAVDGAEPLGVIRLGDVTQALWQIARQTRAPVRGVGRFSGEVAKVIAGRSDRRPDRKDWRFADPAWSDNLVYRRIMQIYLAFSEEMESAVEGADLEWRDAERARLFMGVLVSAAAPTNALAGNPAALKRAFETNGMSLARGLRNRVDDMRNNGGMPAQAKRGAFVVGQDLAATPGAVVYSDEVCEVIQFAPSTPMIRSRPLLMIPPQINKYYFMDLAPGRSFIEYALSRGIPVLTISWRNPDTRHADWNFDTYAAAVLRAVDVARDVTRSDDVNVLGLCAGGILTTTVLSHLAQAGDKRIHSASFGVTLLDFAVPTTIGLFNSGPMLSVARKRSSRAGVLSGPSLGSVFTWMRPNDLVWNYWVNNYLLGKEPPTFDILAWNTDATNLPAALHHQFLDVFEHNTLVEPGGMTVLGSPVDLGRISLETYVTGATTDHLTPWKGCYRTTQLLGGPSTFVLSNAGHIASLVNPPGNKKSHYYTGGAPGPDADMWFENAQIQQGTWWEHWADWALERSGDERKPPGKLGSRRHRVIEPAPGSYVRGLEPVVG